MLIIFLVVVIDLIGFGMIIPLLPFYAEYYEASPAVVGLLMATYSSTQFLAAPVWGRLSDRIGRRPVLLVSLAGAALAYVWLGFAESLWVLFAARAASGAMAGNISAAFAYVADITTPANRAKGMGVVGAAFGLGFIAGPAIGGILAGADPAHADFQTPAFAAAGLSFLALILALIRLKESLSPEIRARAASGLPGKGRLKFIDALRHPRVGLLILLSFLVTFVFAGMEATFPMWSRRQFGWGPEQTGYVFAFMGLMSAMIQGGMIGRLAQRFGEARLILQGAIALACGIALIPFSDSLPLLLTATLILACGFSVITPSLNSLISLQVGEGEQGGIMGIARSATTLARIIGPAWAGLLFSIFGKDWPFYGGALVMTAVIYLSLRSLKSESTPDMGAAKPPDAGN
jgi:DHA1 family tetracycline resistance protein-like MFS transporter